MNEIKKTALEKAIKNADNNHIQQILNNCSIDFAVKVLSVDKNIDLICKKKNFDFFNKLFTDLNNLPESNFIQLLRTSNQVFKMEEYKMYNMKEYRKENKIINNSHLNNFIIKIMDLSISKKKGWNYEDIKNVIKIGKKFNIKDEKIVNWMAKMYAHSNEPKMIHLIKKEPLLQNSTLQERFITVVLNMSENIELLNTIFNDYESKIYKIYEEYKDNNKIWKFLSPFSTSYSKKEFLPEYYSINIIDKINWFENKHLGYNHHTTPFKLLTVFDQINNNYNGIQNNLVFTKLIEDEYYKNLIHNALIDYKKLIVPMIEIEKQKFSTLSGFKQSYEYENLKNKINENMHHKILFMFYENEKILNVCEKINFKVIVEGALDNIDQPKKSKSLKI